MDMVSPREGWIGGNHGNLLHYTGGRWRLETLALDAGKREGLNILALKMSGRDDGHLWVVGSLGFIGRYDGVRWQRFASPRPFDLKGMDMLSDPGATCEPVCQ